MHASDCGTDDIGGDFCGRRFVGPCGAKLTRVIRSPTRQHSVGRERTRTVVTPRRLCGVRAECGHLDRRRSTNREGACAAVRRSIAELSAVVATPAPKRSIRLDRARVIKTHRHGADASDRDLDWNERARGSAVSEVAELVAAPAPKRVVTLDRTSIERARRDRLHARAEGCDVEWCRDTWYVSIASDRRLHRVPDFACSVFTPARNDSARSNDAVVSKARCNRHGVVNRDNAYRRWLAPRRIGVEAGLPRRGAITSFSEAVASPTPDVAVADDRTHVIRAFSDRGCLDERPDERG